MLCHWPAGQRSASQQCPAPRLVARSEYLALVFCLIPGPVSRMQCGVLTNLDWVRRRFHVPRIWTRSINACKFPVKRKTLNVVDTFASCLFVVVMFPPTPSLYCTSVRYFHSGSKILHLTLYASLLLFRCVSSLHRDFSRDRTSCNSRTILRRLIQRSRCSQRSRTKNRTRWSS
jgi:hypothetical protein